MPFFWSGRKKNKWSRKNVGGKPAGWFLLFFLLFFFEGMHVFCCSANLVCMKMTAKMTFYPVTSIKIMCNVDFFCFFLFFLKGLTDLGVGILKKMFLLDKANHLTSRCDFNRFWRRSVRMPFVRSLAAPHLHRRRSCITRSFISSVLIRRTLRKSHLFFGGWTTESSVWIWLYITTAFCTPLKAFI